MLFLESRNCDMLATRSAESGSTLDELCGLNREDPYKERWP